MKCECGRIISDNKTACLACANKPKGVLEILNVQGGDVKISFDKANAAETIRAKRIVSDMLRRGYALLVEVERGGEKRYERAKGFDETAGEYIIADLDPVRAEETIDDPENSPRDPKSADAILCHCGRPLKHRGACKGKARGYGRVPMEASTAVAIPRSAGG